MFYLYECIRIQYVIQYFLVLGYGSSDNTLEMQKNIGNSFSDKQNLKPSIRSINDTNISSKIYSDVNSVRTLASIAIGSTDGRNIIIKRVPNTPNELFSVVNSLPVS